MALILDDDSLLDAADGFAGWDDALTDDMLAQELEQERAVELESELEQDERPIDYDAELEDAEEEAAPTSEKRLKRELRAEALRRLEDAARTAEDFAVVVEEWNKLDRNRERRELWWRNGTSSTATGSAGNGITRTCVAMCRWNIKPCRSRRSCLAG